MEYILGVDGGGTKTTVQIARISGEKVAQAVSGASSCKSVGVDKAIENLNAGVFGAIKNLEESLEDIYFVSSCFGFAGNIIEEDSKIYREIVFNKKLKNYLNPEKSLIFNDTRIGLEAGSDSKKTR